MLHEWFALRPLVLVPEEGVGRDQRSAQGKPRLWQEVTGSAEELGVGGTSWDTLGSTRDRACLIAAVFAVPSPASGK